MAEDKTQSTPITFNDYILNPMGKNNAVLNGATRELMRKSYKAKFDNLMIREHGKMTYWTFKSPQNNQYWIHIKVPSETVENFYYDVVFKFYIDSSKGGINDLFKWNIQFYSNDPAFVYTYAHVFINKKYFIPELKSRMSKEAIEKAANEKNPNNDVGYVKTIYFAYLLMENRNLNKINKFEAEATTLNIQELLSAVMGADSKIADRQEKGKGISKRKKKVLTDDQMRNMRRAGGNDINFSSAKVTTSKRVKTIKSTNKVQNSKNSPRTKRK